MKGYYIFKGNLYYDEFDENNRMVVFNGWPNNSCVSEVALELAKKKFLTGSYPSKRMVYFLESGVRGYRFVVDDSGLRILDTSKKDDVLIVHDPITMAYVDECDEVISRHFSSDERVTPRHFFEFMATEHTGISMVDALEYLVDHIDGFRVDVKLEGDICAIGA